MKTIAGLDRITFDPKIMAGQACIALRYAAWLTQERVILWQNTQAV